MLFVQFQEKNFFRNLNYWNVDLTRTIFSYVEAQKKEKKIKLFPSIM
jgi:hypothetical protein